MKRIKNIAPFGLAETFTGVNSPGWTPGSIYEGEKACYMWAKIHPGTGSVTARRHSALVPYATSNATSLGEFTADFSDGAVDNVGSFGILQGSMMSANTTYAFVAIKGEVPYYQTGITRAIADGTALVPGSTDKSLKAYASPATTALLLQVGGIALENMDTPTAATPHVLLYGKGYA